MKHHTGNPSHLSVLFRGSHRAMGGGLPGNMPSNGSLYKKGGNTHREHHAEGEGVSPVTGDRVPSIETKTIQRSRGGRMCHAEGDMVEDKMRHGGRKKKRHRRADGGMEAMHESPMERMGMNGRGIRNSMNGGPFYAEGGKTETLRRGGKKRKCHAEGGEEAMERLEKMRHGGRKKKV